MGIQMRLHFELAHASRAQTVEMDGSHQKPSGVDCMHPDEDNSSPRNLCDDCVRQKKAARQGKSRLATGPVGLSWDLQDHCSLSMVVVGHVGADEGEEGMLAKLSR